MPIDFWLIYVFEWIFFFCKQKTAYEMRISDWSSDVCSSDLQAQARVHPEQSGRRRFPALHLFLPRWPRHRRDARRSDVARRAARSARPRRGQHPPPENRGRSDGLALCRTPEERRLGYECVSKCRTRESDYY